METSEELEEFLRTSTKETARNALRNQGIAWSMMRVNGVYHGDTGFVGTIDTDLFEFGLSILRASLALRERRGDNKCILEGFETAARTFESLLTNPIPKDADSGFLQIIAACSYHLAGYSAVAFSILSNREGLNNNKAEQALRFLILREFVNLRNLVAAELNDITSSDEHLSTTLANEEITYDDIIVKIANTSICRAIAFFEFALQTGNPSHVEVAKDLVKKVIDITYRAGYVTLWWTARLTFHLLDDLWDHSLHVNLPSEPPEGAEQLYPLLRKKFILALFRRKTSEVELWPSQIEAARRSVNVKDDLVVALPTSAGKTRIAEITALVALSLEKRIFIVTPLRALSAQTERAFKRTFMPMGYSVSSLYGAAGMSSDDQDALKEKSIVIATPEKLDFALRNDSSLLDDVGLLILDEGHMVGPTEREIRYEILVQRLLRRSDAESRRIVCLSAILPDGAPLDNFTQWLRSDEPGTPVKLKWRPTRQRFGILTWQGEHGKLNFDHRVEIPFIHDFLTLSPPRGQQKKARPKDLSEKTIFAAWKFASQGKRVLIFITQASWVETYGKNAVDLVTRGYLNSLLDNHEDIQQAIAVGEEWLGKGHPAVKALEIGMAVHHGALPKPFLRELELLLAKGTIKVTAASPTLSQGLNINAAVLLVPYLVRAGEIIKGEEFANVAGRAGRAFVDVEGFVVHVIVNDIDARKRDWSRLIFAARERNLASGLFQVITAIYKKLLSTTNLSEDSSFEYLASNRQAWFPDTSAGSSIDDEEMNSIESLIEKLDATVFGLISALEADASDLAHLVEEALRGSLWARQVKTLAAQTKQIHLKILTARASLIWSGTNPNIRRGHFAMGVGYDTGLAIDQDADELESLLDAANEAAVNGAVSALAKALVRLAEKLLELRPFIPKDPLPDGWRTVLKDWISGMEVEDIGTDWIPFIEDVFAYRMVWALEAVRMRRVAHGWESQTSSSAAAACLENGVPQFMMAKLIRAGLPSRIAAITAVTDAAGNFTDTIGMSNWLRGRKIKQLNEKEFWPTPNTRRMWSQFYGDYFSGIESEWTLEQRSIEISPERLKDFREGQYRVQMDRDNATLYTPDFKKMLTVNVPFEQKLSGLLAATISPTRDTIVLERFGPGNFISLK